MPSATWYRSCFSNICRVFSVTSAATRAAWAGVVPTGRRTPASISSAATSGIMIMPMWSLVA